jgi:ArsR family transcriptional regulator
MKARKRQRNPCKLHGDPFASRCLVSRVMQRVNFPTTNIHPIKFIGYISYVYLLCQENSRKFISYLKYIAVEFMWESFMETFVCNDVTDKAALLKVLGNHVRLRIVAFLCIGESNVKRIWEYLDIPQATVSQHLALLKAKGIIVGVRDGVEVHYSVVHPLARKILEVVG